MTAIPCAGCGATCSDVFVCGACVDDLRDRLYTVRGLEEDLEITLCRLSNSGGQDTGVRSRSAETPLMFSWPAAEGLFALNRTLAAWARALSTSRGVPLDPAALSVTVTPKDPARITSRRAYAAVHAAWLAEHVGWIPTHPDAAQLLDEIGDMFRVAHRAIDRAPDLHYAGPCWTWVETGLGEELPCEQELYGRAHAATIICPACQTEHDAQARREWLLREVRGQLVTATEASRALPGLLGQPLTASSVRGYAHRGRITAHPPHPGTRYPLYAIGELLDAIIASEIEASEKKRRKAG